MSPSRQLLAAARRAVDARREWNDAQVALRSKDLHEPLRERALERARQQFHTANNFLASIVCQEFNVDEFGNELAALQESGSRAHAENGLSHIVKLFNGIRVTESSGIGRSQVLSVRAPARDSFLTVVRDRVRRARDLYHMTDDGNVQAASGARSAYFAALIEYFNVREQPNNDRLEAAE